MSDQRQRYISGYLQSPQWRARSKRYRSENGSWCRACRQGGRVDIHHMDHSRLGGNEPDSALIALCRKHHNLAHAYWDSGKYRNRKDATMAMVSDVHRKYRFNGPSPMESLGKLLKRLIRAMWSKRR